MGGLRAGWCVCGAGAAVIVLKEMRGYSIGRMRLPTCMSASATGFLARPSCTRASLSEAYFISSRSPASPLVSSSPSAYGEHSAGQAVMNGCCRASAASGRASGSVRTSASMKEISSVSSHPFAHRICPMDVLRGRRRHSRPSCLPTRPFFHWEDSELKQGKGGISRPGLGLGGGGARCVDGGMLGGEARREAGTGRGGACVAGRACALVREVVVRQSPVAQQPLGERSQHGDVGGEQRLDRPVVEEELGDGGRGRGGGGIKVTAPD